MTYRGHVKNRVVVFDTRVSPLEGMIVRIVPVETPLDIDGNPIDPAYLIGYLGIETGISDRGRNIDHYLYGHFKVDDEQRPNVHAFKGERIDDLPRTC